MSIRDHHGEERLFLVTDEHTCEAGVTSSGNNLAGVSLDNNDVVSLFVAAPDGTVMWSVGGK